MDDTRTRSNDPRAVASLICGLVGLFACPLLGSIAAIVLASRAKASMAADPSLEGTGIAHAGRVLGLVGIAFTLFVYAPLIYGAIK